LPGSPAIIEPARLEDDATCTMLASYLTKIAEQAASPSETQRLLRLLLDSTEKTRSVHASLLAREEESAEPRFSPSCSIPAPRLGD
jgi:hypothetical protein